ncbi:MAG TPA: UDP-glucose 4-epimerase GalE [Candidatus Saccharimonadales bacterium]|nr:UDP-glucose 4-epimerase GalE [Candidatus Saccharimonadales bacterium]
MGKNMNILVIGGAGYIGSHTTVELLEAGFAPIVLDDFSGSERKALACIKDVTGKDIELVEGDFADTQLVETTLKKYKIAGVIHFAAFKAVGESVEQPLKYYRNNVVGFISLVELLSKHDIPLVFSSSAAVYGEPPVESVDEETICVPVSPYGSSKLMDEIILRDVCKSKAPMRGIALRYFNVVGAHHSGSFGEMPKLPPQNLLPIIVQAVAGLRPPLPVYGTDYDTPDGTCQRDYIHVVDLAKAHIAALNHLLKQSKGYYDVFNVGTGVPTSVLGMINAFEKINKEKVPHKLVGRRPGDPRAAYANATKIQRALGWKSEKSVEDAVGDAWRWQLRLGGKE